MGDWKVVVPAGRKNYFLDPAFWLTGASDKWSKLGTGTFVLSTEYKLFGAYSTFVSAVTGSVIQYQSVTNDNADHHTLSCFVRGTGASYDLSNSDIQAYWDGAAVDWDSITRISTQWHHCEYSAFLSTSTSRQMGFKAYITNLYIDGMQFEEGMESSTFINADEPGCYALGVTHESQTERSAQFRGGGVIKDLKDDYSFRVTAAQGLGMQATDITVDEYSVTDGGQLNQIKSGIREATLIGRFTSTTADLHELRQALINVLKHNAYPKTEKGWQPPTFVYTGSTARKFFSGYVVKGLEGNWDTEALNLQTTEQVAIKLLMIDPNVYGEGYTAVELDARDSLVSHAGCGYRDWDGQWHWPFTSAPTTYVAFKDILIASTGQVYISIWATDLNGVWDYDYFVAWDPVTETFWQPGSTQTGGAVMHWEVNSIAEDSEGKIYVGGRIEVIGTDTDVNGVARYDPVTDTWNNLSLGMNADVNKIVAAPKGGVYFAGAFTARTGGTPGDYNRVVHYDHSGPTWTALDSGATTNGVNGSCGAIAIAPNGHLFLGGYFETAGNAQLTVNEVCGYDPDKDEFYSLAGGLVRSPADPFCSGVVTTWDGLVYFMVHADTAGGITCNTATMIWNGSGWENMADSDETDPWDALQMSDIALGPDGIKYFAGDPAGSPDGFTPYTRGIAKKGNVWRNLDVYQWGPVDPKDTIKIAIGPVDPANNKRYVIWVGSDSRGDVTRHSGRIDYNYVGNQPYRPTIQITNSSITNRWLMQIRNATTGAALDLNYQIQPGDQLTIDLQAGTVISKIFGNVTHVVLPASDWADFCLLPGYNYITMFATYRTDLAAFMFIKDTFDGVD